MNDLHALECVNNKYRRAVRKVFVSAGVCKHTTCGYYVKEKADDGGGLDKGCSWEIGDGIWQTEDGIWQTRDGHGKREMGNGIWETGNKIQETGDIAH